MESRADKAKRLYEKYSRLMLKVAYDSTDDSQLAEDAVSQTFVKVLDRIDSIDESNEKRTGSLLILMCKQAITEEYKKKCRAIGVPLAEPNSGATEPDAVISEVLKNESPAILRQQLSWLPSKYLEPLILHYVDELSVREIADRLETSESNVYTLLHRARKKLLDYSERNGGQLL